MLHDPPRPPQAQPQSAQEPAPSPERQPTRGLEQLSERFLGKPVQPAESLDVSCDLHVLRAAALALSASPLEPQAALEAALQAAMEAAGGMAVRLYLLDAQGLLQMSAGRSRWENVPFLALVLRLEAGILGRAVRCHEPVLMRERFDVSGPAELATTAEVHCLALPLSVRAQARGVLLIFRESPFGTAMTQALRESGAGIALTLDYLELLTATLKAGRPQGPAAK